MSSDNGNSNDMSRQRRGSVTSTTLTSLFRSNSTSQGTAFPPGPIASAAMNDQRRRLSISTTLGLSATAPPSANNVLRRSSLSTNNSDLIDENAVEEDDAARTAPSTPFHRRMSFGTQAAMRTMRGGVPSPGATNDQGFNWSEQLRSRAESVASGTSRPAFPFGAGASPPRPVPVGGGVGGSTAPLHHHDRAKSVSDLPAPPSQSPRPRQPQKPDHIQERILKGDFYMD